MTGIEVAIVGGMVMGGLGWKSKKIDEAQAKDDASELYEQFFHRTFRQTDGKASFMAATLALGIDSYAQKSIEIIEARQRQLDKKSAIPDVLSSKKEPGDGTPILEELKEWLAAVSAESIVSVEDIAKRISYCQQILIRQRLFGASFASVIAQVSKQLQLLLRDRVANQRTCEKKLDRMLALGREFVAGMLPVLEHSMSSGMPIPANSDLGQVLQTLKDTDHFRALGLHAGSPQDLVTTIGSSRTITDAIEERWGQQRLPDRGTGLHHRFLEPGHGDTRRALLAMARAMDNVAYFLSQLLPFQNLAGLAGDAAMCQLRPSLLHMLQELEAALSRGRQSRLDVMRAAKKELRRAAAASDDGQSWQAGFAKGLGGKQSTDESWQTGLRNVDEARLEELHRELLKACTDMHASGSAARAAELQANARLRLSDIANVLASPELQWHCGHALPEGLANEAKRLALCANGDGASQGSFLAIAAPPAALAPP